MGVPEEVLSDPEGGNKSAVAAKDKQQPQETNNNRRSGISSKLCCCILFVVAAAVTAIVVPVVLLKSGDESTVTPASTNSLANSAEICDVIAQGGSVPDQDTMIAKTYKITMDVSLTSDLVDPAKVVEDLKSTMQMKMGPELADCPNGSRRLRLADEIPNEISSSRELFLDKHIVGNVLFNLEQDSMTSCTAGAPRPCIVVDATMTLYLKEDQNVLSVLNRISSLFQENSLKRILGLSDPFVMVTVTDLEEGTLSPTSAPTGTPMFPPNTPEECEAIARGEPVPTQALLISATFEIFLDVSLTLQLSDLSEVVDEMESRMQRILGPVLADCEKSIREFPSLSPNLIERHLIGNALFDAVYQEGEACDYWAPTPCVRVLTKLTLMLKAQEDYLPLANRIAEIFGSGVLTETLGLTAPFNVIEVVALTGQNPTLAPSSSPTEIPNYGHLPCSRISNKQPVPNQDSMILKALDVQFDVSLTLLLSDLSEVFEEMEHRLQRYIAPKLAGCARRRLSEINDRELAVLERGVIGNAQFFLTHEPDQNCDADAPTPCHRVVGKLNVYLNEDQEGLVLANHITDILFNEELTTALQLTAPFNQIEVVGVTLSDPFVPDPTLSPTPFGDPLPPNSPEACAAIASGLPVPDQDLMIPYDFDLNMRVLLTLQLSDLSEVVDELESRMQRILAPLLADCPEGRRLGETDVRAMRELVDNDIVIGNAQFQLYYLESVPCDTSITAPCIRVDARMRLFLKREEPFFRIISATIERIADKELVDILGLTAPFDEIEILSAVPIIIDQTMEPTGSPTPLGLYGANSPEECEAISLGEPVPGQGDMMSRTFDIRMDVSLTLQLSDLSEVVDEMESRMQRILGPVLADCEENTPNGPIKRHVIATALFDAAYQEDENCDDYAPTPCLRVLTKLTLVLKGPEDNLPLANHITNVLGSAPLTVVLGLTAPFNIIELVGLTAAAPTNPPANSPEGCAAIASGLPVPDQDLMIPYGFDLDMRVLLTLQLSDMSEVVDELESRMQRILAPMLADCPQGRRLAEADVGATRELVDNDIEIGNAQFQLFYEESVPCDTSITAPCIRVDARLRLFLKSEESVFRIISAIAETMADKELVDILGLTAPFAAIELLTVNSMEPTGSPTPLPMYDANSPEECEAIALGQPVPGQGDMMSWTFDIQMDVSLTLQLSDLSEVVEEMESRMQRILGPVLADCEENTTNGPIERHVIANALFDAAYEEEQTCDSSAPSPCIRVLTKLTVILKGEEGILPLVSRITNDLVSAPLTETLGLTAPFNVIEVVGVTVAAP